MVDEEEKKDEGGGGLNEFGFGFTEDDVKPNEESSDDEEYDHAFELAVTVDQLRSPIKKADEFSVFSDAINGLAQNRQQELGLIFGQLNGDQNKQLKVLL